MNFIRPLPFLLLFTTACARVTPPPVITGMPPGLESPTPNLAQIDATSGAQIQATRRAQATQDVYVTATAEVQATRGALATQIQATAEAVRAAQRTAEAAALRAEAHVLETAQAPWPVLVQNSFNAENVLGWPLGFTQEEVIALTADITEAQYRWEVEEAPAGSHLNFIPAQNGALDDFYAAVDVQFLSTTAQDHYTYGLTFYHTDGGYGFFGVGRDGSYVLLRAYGGGSYMSVSGTTSAVRSGTGAINQLAVRANQGVVICFLNGEPFRDFGDNAFFTDELGPGAVGLGLNTRTGSGPGQVAFSNFVVHAP